MTKITTLKIYDIFGEITEIKGTVMGEKTHGYNLPSGAWALYSRGDSSTTPAEFILFRPYKKKNVRAINKNRLVANNQG